MEVHVIQVDRRFDADIKGRNNKAVILSEEDCARIIEVLKGFKVRARWSSLESYSANLDYSFRFQFTYKLDGVNYVRFLWMLGDEFDISNAWAINDESAHRKFEPASFNHNTVIISQESNRLLYDTLVEMLKNYPSELTGK